MHVLFAATVLLSAGLLFWVELLFARMLLPRLGGAPAVWTTCLFFFQAMLLLGYGYAHGAARLRPRVQLGVHAVVLLLPWLVLPVAVPEAWLPDPGSPVVGLLGLLALALGLPFLVVSASAPLLQAWYARLGRPDSGDPYRLYAASNLGSFLALVAYPLLLEPNLSLATQSSSWRVGYGLLVVLTVGCGLALWRSNGQAPEPGPAGDEAPAPPDRKVRARWVLRSFVPAALLYGVTTQLTTDIAPVPLLWVLPLALYLLSFVLAFGRLKGPPRNLVATVLPLALALMMMTALAGHLLLAGKLHALRWVALALHLVGFFAVTTLIHADLARERPDARHLTGYYLWIAGGGLLAGVLCGLVAPLLFTGVLEYPCALLLALLLLPDDRAEGLWPKGGPRWVLRGVILCLGILTPFLLTGFQAPGGLARIPGLLVLLLPVVLLGYGFRLGMFRALHGVVFTIGIVSCHLGPPLLHQERSFFGVHRVVESGGFRHYLSGGVVHGRQPTDPARAHEPTGYYARAAPIGEAVAGVSSRTPRGRVAVLGLGIGGLLPYARPDQRWRFYEIDPAVERIARNATQFTYLRDAATPAEVVLGDGRISLAQERGLPWDLLVLDAFSSDSVPVHLLTREAFALYLDRLAPDGLLVVNVSNRFVDLPPLLASLADAFGLVGLQRLDQVTQEQRKEGRASSHCVVLARKPGTLAFLRDRPGWNPLEASDRVPLWTDDHADLLSVLKGR